MQLNALLSNAFETNKFKSEITEILQSNPIFSNVSKQEVARLYEICFVRTYQKGEIIFKRNQIGIGFYIIKSGKVAFYLDSINTSGETNQASILGKNDFFGETALSDDIDLRFSDAEALEPSTLLVIFKQDLLNIIRNDPKLGNKILLNLNRILVRRLRNLINQTFKSAES